MNTAQAILRTLESPNVCDSNFEAANVVDVLQHIANAGGKIANAITTPAADGRDATGGSISSHTEAVMGITSALVMIAEAINNLATAVEDHGGKP